MSARQAPRFTAVVVLPTPPFWLATAMTRGSGRANGLRRLHRRLGRGLHRSLRRHGCRLEDLGGLLGHACHRRQVHEPGQRAGRGPGPGAGWAPSRSASSGSSSSIASGSGSGSGSAASGSSDGLGRRSALPARRARLVGLGRRRASAASSSDGVVAGSLGPEALERWHGPEPRHRPRTRSPVHPARWPAQMQGPSTG